MPVLCREEGDLKSVKEYLVLTEKWRWKKEFGLGIGAHAEAADPMITSEEACLGREGWMEKGLTLNDNNV